MKIIKGRVLNFIDNPFTVEINKAYKIIENGKLSSTYDEKQVADYMKSIEIKINILS